MGNGRFFKMDFVCFLLFWHFKANILLFEISKMFSFFSCQLKKRCLCWMESMCVWVACSTLPPSLLLFLFVCLNLYPSKQISFMIFHFKQCIHLAVCWLPPCIVHDDFSDWHFLARNSLFFFQFG